MKLPRITIVVTEAGHPQLYARLKVENAPLARAALFKRLAEDGARMEAVSLHKPREVDFTDASRAHLAERSSTPGTSLPDPDLNIWFK